MDFPRDINTKIVLYLSGEDRHSLLAAFPDLKLNWLTLYNNKYTPLKKEFRKIHDDYFPIQKKNRLKDIENYYYKSKYDPDKADDWRSPEWGLRSIDIIYTESYKVGDYIDSIEDNIYTDIRRIPGFKNNISS